MSAEADHRPAQGKHFYRSVVDGVAMANEFLASRLGMSEFARQKGISYATVKYWVKRARELSQAAASTPLSGASAVPAERGLVEVASVSASGDIELSTAVLSQPAQSVSPARTVPPSEPPVIEVRLGSGVSIAVGSGFSPEVLRAVVACLAEHGRPC